jgi:hypothetical protein
LIACITFVFSVHPIVNLDRIKAGMDQRSEESFREEIAHMNEIPYSKRNIEVYRRLNDLEAEI